MTADYYSLLHKAVVRLDRPGGQERRALYERARGAVARQLDGVASEAEIEQHLAALEAAVARIEDGFKIEHPPAASRLHVDSQPPASAAAIAAAPRRRRGIMLAGAGAVLALGLVVGASYLLYPANKPVPSVAREPRKAATAPAQKAEAVAVDNDKASYILRKQRTFYRTTQPAGTIIVSRSQRFLYVVQPSQVAIRYAIGVGPDCAGIAGLFQISEKRGRANGDPPGAAEKANPFGSYALVFGERRAVHQTTEPQNIGQSATAGCFHSWNADIRDLYERVPLHERLVVTD